MMNNSVNVSRRKIFGQALEIQKLQSTIREALKIKTFAWIKSTKGGGGFWRSPMSPLF